LTVRLIIVSSRGICAARQESARVPSSETRAAFLPTHPLTRASCVRNPARFNSAGVRPSRPGAMQRHRRLPGKVQKGAEPRFLQLGSDRCRSGKATFAGAAGRRGCADSFRETGPRITAQFDPIVAIRLRRRQCRPTLVIIVPAAALVSRQMKPRCPMDSRRRWRTRSYRRYQRNINRTPRRPAGIRSVSDSMQ